LWDHSLLDQAITRSLHSNPGRSALQTKSWFPDLSHFKARDWHRTETYQLTRVLRCHKIHNLTYLLCCYFFLGYHRLKSVVALGWRLAWGSWLMKSQLKGLSLFEMLTTYQLRQSTVEIGSPPLAIRPTSLHLVSCWCTNQVKHPGLSHLYPFY
jgi:hypothetical protein